MSATLLVTALEAAVPLWIEQHRNTSPGERQARARICGQEVASHGDLILFKSKKRGETAEAFSRLAEGLALAAFQPGGVRFLGRHWQATDDRES